MEDRWIVFFDVDGTLLEQPKSSWRLIHEILGTEAKADEYAELYRLGRITYEEWARLDASLWRGQDYAELRKMVLHRLKLREGARELFTLLKGLNVVTILISAGLSLVVEPVAKELGADVALSNKLIVKEGRLTGEVEVLVDFHGKGEIAKGIIKRLGLSQERTIAVGDDLNDISIFVVVAHPIAYNPSAPEVAKKARYVIYSRTLYPLKALLSTLILS